MDKNYYYFNVNYIIFIIFRLQPILINKFIVVNMKQQLNNEF